MKNKWKKVLAVVLAFAMVVTLMPANIAEAAKKGTVVVTTQEELEKALKDESVTKIKIKTNSDVQLKIPKGDYADKKLVANAPNVKIVNKGTFEQIAIRGSKSSKWVEKAEGNNIKVATVESNIVVGKKASLDGISFTKEGAVSNLSVKGSVEKVEVKSTMELNVAGTAKEVNVEVAGTAKDAKIVADVPVKVVAETNVKVELNKGAEGSKVETTDSNVKVEVDNKTSEEVVVTTPEGEQKVEAGTSTESSTTEDASKEDTSKDDTATDDTSSGDSSTGGSIGGGNIGGSTGGSTGDKTEYELDDWANELIITPNAELGDNLTVSGWLFRYAGEVSEEDEVSVVNESDKAEVFVGNVMIATLPMTTDAVGIIPGTETTKDATVKVTWKVSNTEVDGVYHVVGSMEMPENWTNDGAYVITLKLVVNGLAPEDLYLVEGFVGEGFAVTPNEGVSVSIEAREGAFFITAEGMDGSLLAVKDGQLLYNSEVLGTLPTSVVVSGGTLKDSSITKEEAVKITWEKQPVYDEPGWYAVWPTLTLTDGWINLYQRSVAMWIGIADSSESGDSSTGGSTEVEVPELKLWDAADMSIFGTDNVSGGSITADVSTMSNVQLSENVDIFGDGTELKYYVTGSVSSFELAEGDGEGRWLLFSLEKPATTGHWAIYKGYNESTGNAVIEELTAYNSYWTYALSTEGNLIICEDLSAFSEGISAFDLYYDVNANGECDADEVVYLVDFSGVTFN